MKYLTDYAYADDKAEIYDSNLEKGKKILNSSIEKGREKIEKGKDTINTRLVKAIQDHPELVENFRKRTDKGRKDLFKDIEIRGKPFLILILLMLSAGSILALNFRLGLTIITTVEVFGISSFLVGILGGMLISAVLADSLKKRYPPVIIILFLSGASIILELFLFQNSEVGWIEPFIIILNSAILGSIIIYLIVFLIEFTTILERGRVVALLLISAGVVFIPVIISAYNDNLLVLPCLVPIFTSAYLFKNRKTEKIHNPEFKNINTIKNEESTKIEIIKNKLRDQFQLIHNNSFLMNLLLLGAFGLLIGLIMPVDEVLALTTMEIFELEFFVTFVILIGIILACTFLVGVIFDFWGRKKVISIFLLFMGFTISFRAAFAENGYLIERQYALITIILTLELICLIPLTVGEIIKPNRYGMGIAVSLIVGFGALVGGIGLQIFLHKNAITALTSLICMTGLFFLVHIKESISRIELDWPDALNHLYIIHESGMLIYDHSFVEEELASSDLISGGIIGLVTMLKEITKSKSRLRTIDHGNKKIMFLWNKSGNVIYVLVAKYELLVLRNKLKIFSQDFQEYFGEEKLECKNGIAEDDWKDTINIINKYFVRKHAMDGLMKDISDFTANALIGR